MFGLLHNPSRCTPQLDTDYLDRQVAEKEAAAAAAKAAEQAYGTRCAGVEGWVEERSSYTDDMSATHTQLQIKPPLRGSSPV